MAETNKTLWQSYRSHVMSRWHDTKSQFYIGFTFCLALMNFIIASQTPDPVGQFNTYVLGLVICLFMFMFVLGLPLHWTRGILRGLWRGSRDHRLPIERKAEA